MKAIVIAFTLKEQELQAIFSKLQLIKGIEPEAILIHGFMPRREVLERGYSTELLDRLDELYPIQLNMWKGGMPLRPAMAGVAADLEADVYVIGDMKYGVAEEVDLYRNYGLNIIHFETEAVTMSL